MAGFFDFARKVTGSEFQKNVTLASAMKPRGVPTMVKGQNFGGMGLPTGGRSSNRTQRYNPIQENLAEELLFQTWMPKDLPSLHQLYRDIHSYDAIAGSAVDLMATLPFSPFNLVGIDDKKVMDIYQTSVENLDIRESMVEITTEFLVLGQLVYSLLFDKTKGVWTDMIPQNIDACRITPIPIYGSDPKIDMKLDAEFQKFLRSADDRDKAAKKSIPDDMLKKLEGGGWIQLEPLNTIFIGRRTNPFDLGTSYLARTLPFYAIEKALVDGTLIESRRRQRAILHISAGIDDVWEPQPEEMDALANLFIQADEDPHGAVVVTRTGVEANEIRPGGEFWKLGDEWAFLSEAKMRALGINEAFLSGEATYNTMEVALSVFIEMIRNLREVLTYRIFHKNMFPTLARVHGFVKRSNAELDHRIRVVRSDNRYGRNYPSMKDSKNIQDSQLLIPQIHWAKQLRPEADENYLDVLSKMEEKGIPVPLRLWSAAGGINLDDTLEMLDDDVKYRKRIADYKTKVGAKGEEEEGGAWSGMDNQFWGKGGNFLALKKPELRQVIRAIRKNRGLDPMQVAANVLQSDDKVAAVGYVLKRMGVAPKHVPSKKTLSDVATHITKATEGQNDKKLNRKIAYEFAAMAGMVGDNGQKTKDIDRKTAFFDPISSSSPKLLSGI